MVTHISIHGKEVACKAEVKTCPRGGHAPNVLSDPDVTSDSEKLMQVETYIDEAGLEDEVSRKNLFNFLDKYYSFDEEGKYRLNKEVLAEDYKGANSEELQQLVNVNPKDVELREFAESKAPGGDNLTQLPTITKGVIVRLKNTSKDDPDSATFLTVTSVRGDKVYFMTQKEYSYGRKTVDELHNPNPQNLYFRGDRRSMSRERFETLLKNRLAGVISEPTPSAKKESRKFTPAEAEKVYNDAHEAGLAAGANLTPTPMIVEERENPWDDNSKVKRSYSVPQGVCGFAWVTIRPANSSYGNWLKKNGKATKAYDGGLQIWVKGFGQSYEKKSAYATAFAKVLRENGIEAQADGRLD